MNRVCAHEGCGTILSTYNDGRFCSIHNAVLEGLNAPPARPLPVPPRPRAVKKGLAPVIPIDHARPYGCTQCAKRFRTTYARTVHRAREHALPARTDRGGEAVRPSATAAPAPSP